MEIQFQKSFFLLILTLLVLIDKNTEKLKSAEIDIFSLRVLKKTDT